MENSPSASLNITADKIEEAIQKATANSTHNAHLTPGRDTRTQLYVGNLPYRVRWQDLKDLFRQAGTVLRADVSLGPDNRSRGYGTILLATAEDAGRAIDRFNGYCWQTRVLDVRVDRLPANGESTGEPTLIQPDDHDSYPSSGKNLFVGNVRDLVKLCSPSFKLTLTLAPLSHPMARPQGFVSSVGHYHPGRCSTWSRWSLTRLWHRGICVRARC